MPGLKPLSLNVRDRRSTTGVFPVPPRVIFPTLITGMGESCVFIIPVLYINSLAITEIWYR